MEYKGAGSHLLGALVRGLRGATELVVGGTLAIVYAGRKTPLPPITDPIILMPAHVLAAKIRTGEVSSESVVLAYAARIAQTDALLNAVVDQRVADAVGEARRVDARVRAGGEALEVGNEPLLGVPFSSKEAVLVEGLSSTCGLVSRAGRRAAEDSAAVARLRSCGGIALAVSNTSELCMWWETYNKLHGRTANPYDDTRTVGGSSGGEAALIASGSSLIGLGTDLGGSIRLPAFFAGIFGHKPSPGLVPSGGQFPPVLSEISQYVSTGPMARYAADLRLVLKALITDEASRQLGLDEKVDLSTVKVFYMLDDGGHPAHTPVCSEVREAMMKAVDHLQDKCQSVEEVHIRNLKHGFMIWCAQLAQLKEQRISQLMASDDKDEEVQPLHWEIWKWLSGRSDHTFPIIVNACAQDHAAPALSSTLGWYLERGEVLREEVDAFLGRGDAIFLYPTYPTPAPRHGQILVSPHNVSYAVGFNSLGLPVTQCPLGLGSGSGLPVGMQIVAGRGKDAMCIAVAEELEAALGGWIPPS